MTLAAPTPEAAELQSPLLTVEDLSVAFPGRRSTWLEAVTGLNLSLSRGETLGLVGESGSGKSATALALMGLHSAEARVSGRLLFEGEDLAALDRRALTGVRGKRVAMIFQDPTSALNPVRSIGDQLQESLSRHLGLPSHEARKAAREALERVGIPDPERRLRAFPHELSGGQNQRVMIAMALAGQPDLLIADEPTTALDVTTQAQILGLLARIQRETGMGLILITHDLGLVAALCQRVAVMYGGRIVEDAHVAQVFRRPQHPYTADLLGSMPTLAGHRARLAQIQGSVPSLGNRPRGCPYHPRCARAEARCETAHPETTLNAGSRFACYNPLSEGLTSSTTRGAVGALSEFGAPILEVKAAGRDFDVRVGWGLRPRKATLSAVDHVSFTLRRGEAFGLVGESGCGKSTLAKMVMGLVPPSRGQITLDGQPSLPASERSPGDIRIAQLVFQDSVGALDPRMRIGAQIAEPLVVNTELAPQARQEKVAELLKAVGLAPELATRYPHEVSGGQRQRAVLARALVLDPVLLICDEPVAALDVSIQAQIINLLMELQREHGLSLLFISHDLRLVRHLCHRIGVMYLGRLVEVAEAEALFAEPAHPYVQGLIDAIPVPDPDRPLTWSDSLSEPASPLNPPSGCRFHPRCPVAQPICSKEQPELLALQPTRDVACHVVHQERPA